MVGTPAIEKCQIAFLRASRPWMDSINKKFPLLWNKVDSRNTVHVKWLKWCGFTFYRREQLTPGGPDFLHFARIDAHVC